MLSVCMLKGFIMAQVERENSDQPTSKYDPKLVYFKLPITINLLGIFQNTNSEILTMISISKNSFCHSGHITITFWMVCNISRLYKQWHRPFFSSCCPSFTRPRSLDDGERGVVSSPTHLARLAATMSRPS